MNIVRKEGFAALTARSLASSLGSSPKPIFGLFENMGEVCSEVFAAANCLYESYIKTDMESGIYPPYKASGMAYMRFAKEEKELFRLLFMRDRSKEKISENREEIRPLLNILTENLGLVEDDAYLFHIEAWIYVHGIASMLATSYIDWDMDFASRALTDFYTGLKYTFKKEED